ncbi:MAG: class I tRNA ligase family protein [Phycisphaerales bacterium]|nr:class I tRNA ligase family protein [Phycisphaerales bacterium]
MAEPADSAGFATGAGTGGAPGDLPKQYRPADHEGRIREAWERSGAFHPDPGRVLRGEAEPYCIIIPPPNVTDRLHLGHALNNTLQDILVRAHRMMGYETLWMPGTDHAGIATQAVVERRLRKEGRLSGPLKQAMTREAFVAIVQSFKDEYEATITGQLRAMGCSCDWQRQRFTMDEQCARAVQEAFFRLFRDGLIYRGKRLVNWDPVLQTAVADDECEDVEVDGEFFYLRYPLVRGGTALQSSGKNTGLETGATTPVTWSELRSRGWPAAENADHADEHPAWVTVATTRPETYLGDTAVAVNPRDPRAGALRGLSVELPLVGRVIPLIEDDYVVMKKAQRHEGTEAQGEEPEDPKAEYATGFLKVTPAHDPNDYEIGQRHNLPLVNIFAPDASISDKHGWTDVGDAHVFVGKSREEAHKLVVREFQARGLLAARRPYRHSVKHSDRSKAAIEPYLSDQWYVRVTDDSMRGSALRAMSQGPSSGGTALGGTALGGTALQSGDSAPTFGKQNQARTRQRPRFDLIRAAGFEKRDPYPPGDPSPGFIKTIHNLPHVEMKGATYFVTWRLLEGELSAPERDSVLSALRFWDGKEVTLFLAVVMHDHVHALVKPLVGTGVGDWVSSIKKFTARQINQGRGATGHLWQDERFDHIVRDERWFAEFAQYILNNPVSAGIAHKAQEYRWFYVHQQLEGVVTEFGRPTTALESGATQEHTGDGSLTFHPERYAKTFEHWHENIRDWCISRQLWWGHRIPVWKGGSISHFWGTDPPPDHFEPIRWTREGRLWEIDIDADHRGEEPAVGRRSIDHFYCVRDTDDRAVIEFLERHGCVRDPDVLDTWFSSALWPMSTMGWPEDTDLLRAYNPSDVLCTAREIITLWVSRMVMFNRYFMPEGWGTEGTKAQSHKGTKQKQLEEMGRGEGPSPFRDVFIHAMIQDGEGRKMSKSLGNGVDPLDIIATHGADAMRFTLCQMTTHTQDVRMPVEKDPATGRNTSPKFDLGRNFCNKLWNAARFALGILQSPLREQGGQPSTPVEGSVVDRWMLSRLASGVAEIDAALAGYSFSVYAQTVYDLLWRDFCDWYLEAIKPTVAQNPAQRAVLAHALETIIRLLHPIAPFITEAVWGSLREIETDPVPGIDLTPSRVDRLLATAGWPRLDASLRDEGAERDFERLRALITAVREVRARHKVPPKRRVTLHVPEGLAAACRAAGPLVATLAGLESISTSAPAGTGVPFSFESLPCHLGNLADAVDEGAEQARLTKLIADLEKSGRTLEGRLANPGYSEKAPPAMVQQTRDQLTKVKADLSAARAALAGLG